MPSFLPGSMSQPYVASSSAIADAIGGWISVGGGLEVLSFEWVFDMGIGTVTGLLIVEHTAQLNGAPSAGTRVLLPLGSVHTTLAGVTLASAPNPSVGVTVTAASSGRVAIHLGKIPAGQIRCTWDFASGAGASPNTVVCYASGWNR